jgi:hypothetical protein
MKNQCLFSICCRIGVCRLLAALVLCLAGPAVGQNLLNNPGFESPLSTNDWVVQFSAPGIPSTNAYGGPGDFAIADRTTEGSRVAGGYGGHIRARTDWTTRAYFTQTVSGLVTGATYHVSGYMKCSETNNSFHVFIEAVGGLGDATGDSRFTVRTPDAVKGSAQTQYFLDQMPDPDGKIEVRLRFAKTAMLPGPPSYTKFLLYSGYFDDLSVTP